MNCGWFVIGMRAATCMLSLSMCMSAAFAQAKAGKSAFARGCEQMINKKFSQAISSFTEAIADDEKDVNSYFRRGQSFFCQGNYKEAIVDFNRALARGAMDYNVYLWKGTADAKLGNVDQATFNYEKAMRLNPKLVEPFRSSSASDSGSSGSESNALVAGQAKAEAGKAEFAKSEAGKAKLIKADAGKVEISKAEAGKVEVSKAEAGKVEIHNAGAGNLEPAKASTSTISLSGSSEQSVDAYKKAAQRILQNTKGYFRAGTAYSGLLNIANQPVPLSGFNSQLDGVESTQNGHAYFSLKDAKRDLRELDAQIILHPQDATLFFQRASAWQQLGKTKETLDDLNRAVELDGSNPNYFLARAFYYHQQKDITAAATEVLRAQDVDPLVPSELSFDVPPPTVLPSKESVH